MNTLKLIWSTLVDFTKGFWKNAVIIYAVYTAVIAAVIGIWGFIEFLTKKGE